MTNHKDRDDLPVFDDPEEEAIFARQSCQLDKYPARGNGPEAQLNRAIAGLLLPN